MTAERAPILFESDSTVLTFAWPGGYRVWYVTHDAADLCAECVQANLSLCMDPEDNSGWRIVGHYSEAETDSAGPCDHCNRPADTAQEDDPS